MRCAQCNVEVANNAKFCSNCGEKISGTDSNDGDKSYGDSSQIHTEGGAYVVGNVSTGGDFVGRDKVIHGDNVHGDKIAGDKVAGDKFSGDKIRGDRIDVGSISGSSGIAFGRNAKTYVTRGTTAPSGEQIGAIFAPVYRQIAQLSMPTAVQLVIQQQVEAIEQEAAKGAKANKQTIEDALTVLNHWSPDIHELVTFMARTIL